MIMSGTDANSINQSETIMIDMYVQVIKWKACTMYIMKGHKVHTNTQANLSKFEIGTKRLRNVWTYKLRMSKCDENRKGC